MNTDRDEAAQIAARFAKYQNNEPVPQSDRDLLAFLESLWFIVPALIVAGLMIGKASGAIA